MENRRMLLFIKEGCSRCGRIKMDLSETNIKPDRICSLDTIDGMAEASYHNVVTVPTIVIVDDNDDMVHFWSGVDGVDDDIFKETIKDLMEGKLDV